MLRRVEELPDAQPAAPVEGGSYPSPDQPFIVEDHPPGIRFYQGRASFFHPYALLQTMSYNADSLKIVFADAEVLIQGRGLHVLYLRLAEHRVACIVEQGGRFVDASNQLTHISRIKGTGRPGKKQQHGQQPPEPSAIEPGQ